MGCPLDIISAALLWIDLTYPEKLLIPDMAVDRLTTSMSRGRRTTILLYIGLWKWLVRQRILLRTMQCKVLSATERLQSTPCRILAATIMTLVLEPTDALLASRLISLGLHALIRLRHPRPSNVPTGAAQNVPMPCLRVRQTVKLVMIAPLVLAGVVMSIPLLVLNVLPVPIRKLLNLNGTDCVK